MPGPCAAYAREGRSSSNGMRHISYPILSGEKVTLTSNRKHTKTVKIWADEEIGHACIFQVTASDDNVRCGGWARGLQIKKIYALMGADEVEKLQVWEPRSGGHDLYPWVALVPLSLADFNLRFTSDSEDTRYGWESNIVSLSKAEIFPLDDGHARRSGRDLKWKGDFQLFCRSEKGMIRSTNNRTC